MTPLRFACMLLLALIALCLPAMAGSWLHHDPVALSPSSTSVTVDLGASLGRIDKIRFSIDGATVRLNALQLIPVNGTAIALHIPVMLKSGEASGLIAVPGNGTVAKSLRLDYAITDGNTGAVTFKIHPH